MIIRCSHCGSDAVMNVLRTTKIGTACWDSVSCRWRMVDAKNLASEQMEADAWYAEEVKRMAERASA